MRGERNERHRIEDVPALLQSLQPGEVFGDYFDRNTGRLFDRFVLQSDPSRFEPVDLLAVEMLSVSLHADGVERLLLDSQFASRCSQLLREIPAFIDVWEVDPGEFAAGSASYALWEELRSLKGATTGVTVISKLMAAKRPRLFPVWDAVVASLFVSTDEIWRPIHELLGDPESRKVIADCTSAAPAHIGLLRRLDVALWREGKRRVAPRHDGNSA